MAKKKKEKKLSKKVLKLRKELKKAQKTAGSLVEVLNENKALTQLNENLEGFLQDAVMNGVEVAMLLESCAGKNHNSIKTILAKAKKQLRFPSDDSKKE